MKYPLFSELGRLYQAGKDRTNVIRSEVRLKDPIDGVILRRAVDTTMKRYPYFAVTLRKEADTWFFEENKRPVSVAHTERGVELNTEASGYHLLSFAWMGNTIYADVFHALTDGTGVYELMRTLLYSYCAEFYHHPLCNQEIRLAGEPKPPEEWEDPTRKLPDAPAAEGNAVSPAINLMDQVSAEERREKKLFSIFLDEAEYMAFCAERDSSPGSMTALLLSRAVASVHPDSPQPVRIRQRVNQRKALRAPIAHQSLVGGWAMLEFKVQMRSWPLSRQATAFRGMFFAETMDENVLANQQVMNRSCRKILSLKTDAERAALVKEDDARLSHVFTATVSYVGKGYFGEAEQYITDFHTLAFPMVEGILIEISAVHHQFTLDFIQNFSSAVYLEAFLKEFEQNRISYRFQGEKPLCIPGIALPWLEDKQRMEHSLCSHQACFITGENIRIDGGMTRLIIYHGEQGWSYAD